MKRFLVGGLLVSLLIGAVFSYLASESPDGLERVAEDLGFASRGEGSETGVEVMPDYQVEGIESPFLSGAAAGVIGVIVVLLACLLLGRFLGSGGRPRRQSRIKE